VAGLSQAQLGSMVGARQATVCQVEAGKPGVRIQTILDLLAALGLGLKIVALRASGGGIAKGAEGSKK
jgi:DNA-binding XRE family transcriptional regulator